MNAFVQTFSRTTKSWLEPVARQYHGSSLVASSSRATMALPTPPTRATPQSEQNTQSVLTPQSDDGSEIPNTHFKITLLRSAIGLGDRKKGTLTALGIHRRMQTVYHPHSPETAGKILAVKELLRVENVPSHAVRTKTEQRRERRPPRGYSVNKRLDETWLDSP